MTLSDISIKNPVFAWMLMSALIFFGLISYNRMGVSQLPDVDFPVVTVNLSWEGAAPEVMETDIVDIAEDAVMGIQGIRSVSSSIRQGGARISIEFDLDKKIDDAVNEVQTKIAQAQRLLPKEMDPPTVNKVNPEDQPIIWLTVTGGSSLRDLMEYVQNYLKDKFTTINGVGEIILGGFVDRNLRIWVDESKLESFELTADDVISAVQNQHQEVPAGRIENSKVEKNLRVLGEAPTPEDFGRIVIDKRSNNPIYKPIHINDVARIENNLSDVRSISRTNGLTGVGLGIRKQRGANEVAVAQSVLKRLEEIKRDVPKGIQIEVAFNKSKFIEDSIQELTFTLILSALVTSLVCWLFLGSWSATLNILLAIPTSILGSFIVIYFLGFTLNTFTVLGLTLAVGIVVDDAIMVLENIVRYRENGVKRVEAARIGARQITFAALAATIALVAIFLPVAFMKGIIGKFFYQYGVTISVAVLLSLMEALTLTPMRCSQFLKVGERTTFFGKWVDKSFKHFADFYKRTLGWVLNHRALTIIGTILFFIGSLALITQIRQEFLPSQDQSIFLCRIQTPPGSSIDFTKERFERIEKFVMGRSEVKKYFGMIGGFSGGVVNQGMVFVTLKDPNDRPIIAPFTHKPSQSDIIALFRSELNKIPDVKATMQDLSLAGFSSSRGFPVEFTIRGPNWDKLAEYSSKLMEAIKGTKMMVDVDSDYLEKVSEVHIVPDRIKASARGVNVDVIGKTINSLIGGEPIAKYTENGRRYDVRIRLNPKEREDQNQIGRLQVWNNRGELVSLSDVITMTEEKVPLTITRIDRERAISIFANVAPGQSQTSALAEVDRIAKKILPEGYRAVFAGSAQTFKESFLSLLVVLFLGIVVSYMVLASQFNSYIHPITILLSLPFSISGALIALLIAKQSINIYSFIGIILLMGIVKKNSILLVDFTNHFRSQGASVRDALIKACPIRLRPIIMTSFATIAAAIPPVLALGPGSETRVPMAIAVIGGVILSTLLTLLVVPCAYSLFAKFELKKYAVPEDLVKEIEGDRLTVQ